MRKQLISFAQVIKFFVKLEGANPKPHWRTPFQLHLHKKNLEVQ